MKTTPGVTEVFERLHLLIITELYQSTAEQI